MCPILSYQNIATLTPVYILANIAIINEYNYHRDQRLPNNLQGMLFSASQSHGSRGARAD